MSLDRIGPCRQCGQEVEGHFCSFSCELDYANAQDAKAEQLREDMREARTARRARQAGRQAEFATWGPK